MTDPSKPALIFMDATIRSIHADAAVWLRRTSDFSAAPFDRNAFSGAFAVAARKLGTKPVEFLPEEVKALDILGPLPAPDDWDAAAAGRAAMLLAAAERLPPDDFAALTADAFYRGDNLEKKAVLRAMVFAPASDRFLPLAHDACRTSVQTVFEAITCDNPYPALHFDDPAFNQMVLKALFTGAPLERIAGFEKRCNAELVRMASDYAAERTAAGREVPRDIAKILEFDRRRR